MVKKKKENTMVLTKKRLQKELLEYYRYISEGNNRKKRMS